MQRIAGMIVKAGGFGFEATYNGQRDKVVEAIREEMERQKAAMSAEMDRMKVEFEKELQVERDRADINSANCSSFRRKELSRLNNMPAVSPLKRAAKKLGNAYALVVGTMMCLPEIGETLGLWEIIREEDEHEEYERAAFAARRQRRKEPRIRTRVY